MLQLGIRCPELVEGLEFGIEKMAFLGSPH